VKEEEEEEEDKEKQQDVAFDFNTLALSALSANVNNEFAVDNPVYKDPVERHDNALYNEKDFELTLDLARANWRERLASVQRQHRSFCCWLIFTTGYFCCSFLI